MKKLFFVAFLLLVNLLVFSQYREVLLDDSGNPIIVRLFDEGSVKNYFLNEVSDDGLYTIDTEEGKLFLDAGLHGESSQGINNPLVRSDMMNNFDPSLTPNGDFVQKISYTPDGEFIAVLHKHSDNLFLYNSSNFEVEQIIDLGRGPMDMKITNDFIYVCCYYAKEIQIVDLQTFSVTSTIILDKNPCQIEINPENSIAYVGLTDDDKGAIAAFSLDDGKQIFETSDPKIYLIGRSGINGRVGFKFMKFYLSPGGDKIIAANSEFNMSGIYSAVNGDLLQTYSPGDLLGAGFSNSGDTLFCAFLEHPSKLYKAYRIDMTNLTVIDSIVASTLSLFSGDFADLCVSSDGSKMLSTGDWLASDYYYFDFKTYQYNTIPAASLKFSNTVLKIEDLDYAVVFNLGYFDIVDMNTGQLVVTSTDDIEVGWTGAISPSGNKMFLSDCVTEHTTFEHFGEELHAIDISDPSSYIVDTSYYAGNAYEADETNMAYLIDDGKKLIACNKLSHNISVVDVETGLTDTLIYHKGISGFKIIPDKNQAIIFADYHDTIRILDLDTYKYIANLYIGDVNVNVLVVSNDGQWAYLLDYNPNGGLQGHLSKVRLDGAASSIVDKIPLNAQWARYWNLSAGIVICGAADITPDGKYFFYLEKNEYDDYFIGIVDVEGMKIVASLPTDANAIFGFAFSDDSKWALPLCYTYSLPIVYIDGENSFINTSFPVSYHSLSAAYNPVDGLFYALQSLYQYHAVDPETGEIVKTFDTNDKFQFNIKIDNAGNPAVLTTTKLIYKDEIYPMIGKSTEMNYYKDQDIFVIPVPGPDKIVTFGDLLVDIPENPPCVRQKTFDIIQNPTNESILIKADFFINRIEIMDITGAVQIKEKLNGYNPTVNVSMLKSGIYLVRLISGADALTQKMYVF